MESSQAWAGGFTFSSFWFKLLADTLSMREISTGLFHLTLSNSSARYDIVCHDSTLTPK
ncbi:hypothetical protein M404DRAFT_992903 [Pisolithus tinctorius Marx 270]|uniref:Uncharacterized protein n=1 Tax=Pisolithus tinctorius Marx 270 TaxID=870435 RepID=A0A0C3KV32_PISTI|nr:hypothetical protein M404DRAFT_992903 [Pisolithus tinctorius Marx 270]